MALIPQANYTDRSTDRHLSTKFSATVVNLSFVDRSRYFSFKVAGTVIIIIITIISSSSSSGGGRTSGRPLLYLSRGPLPSGPVLCGALLMCVGSIRIDSPSAGRLPVPHTDLRVGCTLCDSLVCDVCTSGRPLLDGWAAALCLRARFYVAPFYMCGLDQI
jgi:hypothetical protein